MDILYLFGKLYSVYYRGIEDKGHRGEGSPLPSCGLGLYNELLHTLSLFTGSGIWPSGLTDEGGDTDWASRRWPSTLRRQPCAGRRPSPQAPPLCNSSLCQELPARSKVDVTDNLSEPQLPHLGKGDNHGSPRSMEVAVKGSRLEPACSSNMTGSS